MVFFFSPIAAFVTDPRRPVTCSPPLLAERQRCASSAHPRAGDLQGFALLQAAWGRLTAQAEALPLLYADDPHRVQPVSLRASLFSRSPQLFAVVGW